MTAIITALLALFAASLSSGGGAAAALQRAAAAMENPVALVAFSGVVPPPSAPRRRSAGTPPRRRRSAVAAVVVVPSSADVTSNIADDAGVAMAPPEEEGDYGSTTTLPISGRSVASRRRLLLSSFVSGGAFLTTAAGGGSTNHPPAALAYDEAVAGGAVVASSPPDPVPPPPLPLPVEVVPNADAKPLFNEARALELQGRIEAARRLYGKVTNISPRFVYGWSNLGNAQVALGQLDEAEGSYTEAVNLCRAKNAEAEGGGIGGGRKCGDLYLILLNRGCLRLNTGRVVEALRDLEESDSLRGRPDPVVLQNRARARELNGLYAGADRDYSVAISMTSNEVAPFWLRAALVKFQLGDSSEAYNLLRRVENRFPEAPEVRAASAAILGARGDMEGARRKYLEMPDRQRLKFADGQYLTETISWPPKMRESLAVVTKAVGDSGP